jgi:hypothetical protein
MVSGKPVKKRWNKADLRLLKCLAGNTPIWRIAQQLGRSELAVRWRAKREGIALNFRFADTS